MAPRQRPCPLNIDNAASRPPTIDPVGLSLCTWFLPQSHTNPLPPLLSVWLANCQLDLSSSSFFSSFSRSFLSQKIASRVSQKVAASSFFTDWLAPAFCELRFNVHSARRCCFDFRVFIRFLCTFVLHFLLYVCSIFVFFFLCVPLSSFCVFHSRLSLCYVVVCLQTRKWFCKC